MPRYEYKVVPAPQKGLKAKGLRTAEARFSNALESLMNAMGEEGWEYQRSDTLPSIERSGLTSTTTEWRNVLVFRRLRETDAETFAPELLPPPEPPVVAEPEPASEVAETAAEPEAKEAPEPDPTPAEDGPKRTADDVLAEARKAAEEVAAPETPPENKTV